jgi:hypothetical protein
MWGVVRFACLRHYARGDAGPAGHRSLRSLGSELNLCAAGDRLQVRPVGERIDPVNECEAECESCARWSFFLCDDVPKSGVTSEVTGIEVSASPRGSAARELSLPSSYTRDIYWFQLNCKLHPYSRKRLFSFRISLLIAIDWCAKRRGVK